MTTLTAVDRAALGAPHGGQGVDVVVSGELDRERVSTAVGRLLEVWPALGSRADRGRWVDPQPATALLTETRDPDAFARFRDAVGDPAKTPPLRVLWRAQEGTHRLSLGVHPAAADDQAMFHVFVSFLLALVGEVPLTPKRTATELVQVRPLLAGLRLGEVARHIRHWAQFARGDAVFRLPRGTRSVATYSRWINTDVVVDKANRLGTSPLALVASAWARALAEHQPDDPRELVVAVPLSLRNEVPDAGSVLSNLMWPIYVPVDRRAPLHDAARAFAQQVSARSQAHVHYARPLAALGRRRFWRVARRFPQLDVPADFGSTRVSWTGHPAPLTERLGHAGLRLVDQQIFTPVPQRMGATLTVVTWPYGTQFLVNYRPDSLGEGEVSACVSAVQRQIEG